MQNSDSTPPDLSQATELDLTALISEFRTAGMQGDFWQRMSTADDTRLARWDGQSDDGKKHDNMLEEGKPAFPWDGASDVRCYMADEVCNENVSIDMTAFWKSDLRVEAVESGDMENASNASTFANWMIQRDMRANLEEDSELSSQYKEWYGWCALHVDMERTLSFKNRSIKLQDLQAMADKFDQARQQGAELPPELAELGEHVSDLARFIDHPDADGVSAKAIQFLYRTYVNSNLPAGVEETDIPELAMSKARKMVAELRSRQATVIPLPYLCSNKPRITALKPWRDIVIPADTTDIQSARAIFVRRFMSEAELRSMVTSDGWSPEFVEEAVKTKGKLTVWAFSNQGLLNPLVNWSFCSQKNNLIELVIGYHKAVDENGVLAVYYTIFSAGLTTTGNDTKEQDIKLVAKSGLLDGPHADLYPIAAIRREMLDRQVQSSRGVPEILLTSQREEKVIRDAVVDWTSIAVIPPLNVYKSAMGQRYKFAPAAENQVTAGREPKFMEVPTAGPVMAEKWLSMLDSKVDHYFGRFRENVPPQLSQLLMGPRVQRYLQGWSQALKMAFEMYLYYVPETFERVTGSPPPDADTNLDFVLHFDVAQLNPELMEKKLALMSALLPEDSQGVIDRSALIRIKARAIDPMMARELVQQQGPATQQMLDKVQMDMVKMSDGNEAQYSDASQDPAAQNKLQFLQQTVQNNQRYLTRLHPEVLQMLGVQAQPQPQGQGQQPDVLFSQMVQKYAENLQQGVAQQQNKQVGRIGVKPMSYQGVQ